MSKPRGPNGESAAHDAARNAATGGDAARSPSWRSPPKGEQVRTIAVFSKARRL